MADRPMTQRPLAVIDIDDVLSDTTTTLLRELNARHGTDYSIEAMTTQFVWDSFKIPAQHVLELVLSPDFQNLCAPIEGAVAATHRMQAQGYEVWLVTARPTLFQENTEAWLKHWGFAYDHLEMNQGGTAKAGCLPRSAAIAFEDHAETAFTLAQRSEVVYLFARPWNRELALPDNVRRIAGWGEVEIFEG